MHEYQKPGLAVCTFPAVHAATVLNPETRKAEGAMRTWMLQMNIYILPWAGDTLLPLPILSFAPRLPDGKI